MNHLRASIIASVIILSIVLAGCSTNPSDSGSGSNANDKVSQGNAALEGTLFTMISTNFAGVTKPSDVNFQPANSLYKDALALDAQNVYANFGAALTEILVFTSDATVNQVWNKWKAYVDTASVPFAVPGTFSAMGPFGLPNTGFPVRLKDARISPMVYPALSFGMAKLAAQSPPQISEIQNLLTNQLLPRLDYALARLDVVVANPNFTFIISPKMQGDLHESPLELDLTEVYAFQTMLNMARSMVLTATSYSFDFASYDSTGWITAMTQSSGFLGLRSGGATQMSNARSALISATQSLDSAVAFLKAETDDQSNDVIKRGTGPNPNGPTSADLDSVITYTNKIRDYLTNPQSMTEDFDGNPMTAKATVSFDLKQFFTNPIDNLKAKFPSYTVAVERDTTHHEMSAWGSVPVVTSFYAASQGSYFYSKWCNWDRWGYNNCWENGQNIPRFAFVADSIWNSLRARGDVVRIGTNFNWSSYFNAPGTYDINTSIYYNYSYDVPDKVFYVPVVIWDANSFGAWTFPDATFNGFLPGMTDGAFKTTFGINGGGWQKRNSFAGMFGR